MTDDVTKPIETAPPRPVHPWTRVVGHSAHTPTDTLGGPKHYCSCGWQSSGSYTEREAHVAQAWPVLVPKPDGASMTAWVAEVEVALREAEGAEDAIDRAQDQQIEPGQPYPVITEESSLAGDRVRVLRHQLRDVMERAGMDTSFLPRA